MWVNTYINKKQIIIFFLLSIVLCTTSCQKQEFEYPPVKRTMIEENGIKYFLRGGSEDYSFDEARLELEPKDGFRKEIVDNRAQMSIDHLSSGYWQVYLHDTVEDNGINGEEGFFTEGYAFKSEGDFSEETIVDEPSFHDNHKTSYYYITNWFATPEELRQIVENGEIICAELNAGNVAYLEKALIVTE